MRFIKASKAKTEYGIPDRIYREACHGAEAIAVKPGGVNGHCYFEVTRLESFLKKRMAGEK